MLNERQLQYLGAGLDRYRVNSRNVSGRSMAYLEAWDVRRTLIRIFGYGGFNVRTLKAEQVAVNKATSGNVWDVSWLAQVELFVPALECVYTEFAVGTAHLPDLGEAHDMAVKTAESDALKRCAVNLGTQFGLSLYAKGNTADVVKWTLDTGLPGDISTEEHVVPDQDTEPATAQTAAEAPQAPTEQPPAQEPDQAVQACLDALRALYEVTGATRLKAVAELKARTDTKVLQTVIPLEGGGQATVARLMDRIASDAMAPN